MIRNKISNLVYIGHSVRGILEHGHLMYDFTSLAFFLGGFLKSQVYAHKPSNPRKPMTSVKFSLISALESWKIGHLGCAHGVIFQTQWHRLGFQTIIKYG